MLEAPDGRLVGIEVKASGNVSSRAFSGLRALAEEQPEQFVRGLVLYDGDRIMHFDDRLVAVPYRSLWQW